MSRQICLFPADATSFDGIGLGTLPETTSCKVTEERNGAFELELRYPTAGLKLDAIVPGRYITAKPNPYDPVQPFRIYKVTKPMRGQITVYAEHISYQLNGMIVTRWSKRGNPAEIINYMLSRSLDGACGFSATTDITELKNVMFNTINTARALIGGVEGSVIDTFGGELAFNGKQISLLRNRGADRGVKIHYGRNLLDLNQATSIEGEYTGIYPYYRTTMLDAMADPPEEIDVEFGTSTDYVLPLAGYVPGGQNRILKLDVTDMIEFDGVPLDGDIVSAASQYADAHNLTAPTVNTTVRFYSLDNSDEYAGIHTEEVHLCDIVHLENEKLGINMSVKVIKTVYDELLERYDSIDVGTPKSTFADTATQMQSELASAKDVTNATSDYVVSKGTAHLTASISGTAESSPSTSVPCAWSFIRWKSGRVEAWATIDFYTSAQNYVTINMPTISTGGRQSTVVGDFSFPNGLFNSPPIVDVSVSLNNYSMFASLSNLSASAFKLRFYSPDPAITSENVIPGSVKIHAFGNGRNTV